MRNKNGDWPTYQSFSFEEACKTIYLECIRSLFFEEVFTMRSFDEIGKFVNLSNEVNEAYATYASAYLDCADDNLNHFLGRGMDTRPIDDITCNVKQAEPLIIKRYIDSAIEIVNQAGFRTMEEIVASYPLLEKYQNRIVLATA